MQIYDGRFAKNTDYHTAFKLAVDELYSLSKEMVRLVPVLCRKAAAHTLIEAYIAQTGERPNHIQLDRLATWILKGDEEERKALKEVQKQIKEAAAA
jgi:hypothetical protein